MKKLIFTTVFAFLFAAGSLAPAQNPQQEYLGLPGDNLNLFAVMNLFQESKTLEAFERSINDPEAMINNLDLNGDGYVDYIMVHDYQDGNIHNIVLRVALYQDEYQDVAVFVVEKLRDGSVRIQLIGDQALYGPNYIIEPNYAERANPGYQGTAARTHSTTLVHTTYYEVAQWPVIVYMHRPAYRPWRSAWYYGYHPAWWSPWSPHYYHYYYGYHYHWHGHYHAYYRPCRNVRSVHYHTVYVTNHRNTSPTVVTRVEQGRYRNTYSNPDKVQDGQQLFAQRHPGRYEQVATKSNIAAPELRQSPGSVQDVKQSPSREAGTPGTATERRQDNAVRQSTERQSSEDVRRQSPAVTPSRDNRSIQHDNSRQQAQPVRSQGSETSPRQQAQPTRSQESEASPRRENNSPAVRSTPPPARQSSPPPQREVNRPASQRNTSTPPSSPPRVNQNNRPSSPAVSSPPARSTQQPSSNVRPSGSNNRSTPAPSRSSNNKRSGSSNENNNSSERRR